jgi:membrane dipeptidase
MQIVDAHLDLSYNALRGRDVLRPAVEQPADEGDIATVGLPDLRAGEVGLVCATIFCGPSINGSLGYRNAQEAHDAGMRHLDWYRQQHDAGHLRIIRNAADLADPNNIALRALLLLEGADPLRTPEDVPAFFEAGVRIVGLAWRQTRFAGGTGAPGPLTPDGVDLIEALDSFGIIHDASHLAEESFWQLLDLSDGPVIASHSNCRSIVPTDRQLSDAMAEAVFQRGGVIGINFFDKFLLPPEQYGHRRANLTDVAAHIHHFCDLAGDTRHVGIGTDMDGGLGRDQIPSEITTSADLPRIADALATAGFDDVSIQGIMGANWLRYFRERLPK